MSRRLVAALVAVAAVLVGVVLGMVFWPSDDEDTGFGELSVEDLAALDLGARELVSLAVRGQDEDFHAVYEGTGGRRLEVWTLGDRLRQLHEAPGESSTITQRVGDERTRCVDDGDDWTCESLPRVDLDDEDIALHNAVEQLTADLVRASVTVTDDEIAGVAVRCFALEADEVPIEVCLTLDGHVARMDAGESSLELTLLDEDVTEDDFDLPA